MIHYFQTRTESGAQLNNFCQKQSLVDNVSLLVAVSPVFPGGKWGALFFPLTQQLPYLPGSIVLMLSDNIQNMVQIQCVLADFRFGMWLDPNTSAHTFHPAMWEIQWCEKYGMLGCTHCIILIFFLDLLNRKPHCYCHCFTSKK